MKKQMFALLGLSLMLATVSAYGQTVLVKANIPFNFSITGANAPRGMLLEPSEFLATECCDSNAARRVRLRVQNNSGTALSCSRLFLRGDVSGYAYANHHTHGANWQHSTASRSYREDR